MGSIRPRLPKGSRAAAALAVLLAATGAASAQSAGGGAPPAGSGSGAGAGDARRGFALFKADGCYECHGLVGQGGGAGPRLAPDPLPAEAIAAYIRAPANVMPPYSSTVVSDQDVQDIRAYLASVPPPPPVADIPLLSQLAR